MNEIFEYLSTEVNDFYWSTKIERVSNPPPLEFYRKYVSKNKPVIITNLFNNWEALRLWNHQYLKQVYGDVDVSVDITPSGHGDCVVPLNDEKLFLQPDQIRMKFGDFIDIMNGDKKRNRYLLYSKTK